MLSRRQSWHITMQLGKWSTNYMALNDVRTHFNTNEAYYKRQLSVYNCGTHDCGANRGYFHMWHEATASRGPAEIASRLWHWLQSIHTERSISNDWAAHSHSCGGQNRNIVIAAFGVHVVQEMEVQCTDHVLIVSSHSFLPCDDFGVDEKEKHMTKMDKRRSQK